MLRQSGGMRRGLSPHRPNVIYVLFDRKQTDRSAVPQTNLANTVHEKYELIDDLNKYKQAHGDLETRMAVER